MVERCSSVLGRIITILNKVISVRQVGCCNFVLPNGIKASRSLYRSGIYQIQKRVRGGGYYYKLINNYGDSCFSKKKAQKLAAQSNYLYDEEARHGKNVELCQLSFIGENI